MKTCTKTIINTQSLIVIEHIVMKNQGRIRPDSQMSSGPLKPITMFFKAAAVQNCRFKVIYCLNYCFAIRNVQKSILYSFYYLYIFDCYKRVRLEFSTNQFVPTAPCVHANSTYGCPCNILFAIECRIIHFKITVDFPSGIIYFRTNYWTYKLLS